MMLIEHRVRVRTEMVLPWHDHFWNELPFMGMKGKQSGIECFVSL